MPVKAALLFPMYSTTLGGLDETYCNFQVKCYSNHTRIQSTETLTTHRTFEWTSPRIYRVHKLDFWVKLTASQGGSQVTIKMDGDPLGMRESVSLSKKLFTALYWQ